MTTTDVSLNGVSLSTAVPDAIVVDVDRPLVGARRHDRVAVPGRPGSWTFDEVAGDRTLTLSIHIQSSTTALRRAAVRDLAYWADVGTTSKLIIDDEPDRYHEALLDTAPDVSENLNEATVELVFAVGPYALDSTTTTESLSATTNPDSGIVTVTDRVTVEPIVEITPDGGTLLSWTITFGDYALSWSGSLADGETITVSSLSDTVTLGGNDDVNLTGTFDVADLDMADVSGNFPLLVEGSNAWSFEWTGTATSVAVDLLWRERYR